jgi:hypothetical protein
LVLRCISFGAVLGGTESALQVARDKIGVQMFAEARRKREEEGGLNEENVAPVREAEHMLPPPPVAAEMPRYALVDRDPQPGAGSMRAIDELISGEPPREEEEKKGWWGKAKSWIPGQ